MTNLPDVAPGRLPDETNDPILAAAAAIASLRQQQLRQEDRIQTLEREALSRGDLLDGYLSVTGYFNLHGGTVTETDAQGNPIAGQLTAASTFVVQP